VLKINPARLVPVYAVLIVSLSIALIAQSATGSLSGTVKDASGAAVANATISAKNSDSGQVTQVQTDAQGAYRFEALPTGSYELSASGKGLTAAPVSIVVTSNPETEDLSLGGGSGLSMSDLGFSKEQTQSNPAEQARLDKRTHMLKIHQKMGLITAVPLAATIITGFGAGGKQTSTSTRDLHVALGTTTAALYFTTASFAIFAPKIPGTETKGPIRVHKALAWVHGTGMILTPILGAIAFQQKSRGEKIHGIAQAHGPVAIITGAAYGAALLSVSVKF